MDGVFLNPKGIMVDWSINIPFSVMNVVLMIKGLLYHCTLLKLMKKTQVDKALGLSKGRIGLFVAVNV